MATYTPLLSDPALVADVQNDAWGSPPPTRAVYRSSSFLRRIIQETDRTVWVVLLACLVSVISLVLNILTTFHSGLSAPRPTKLTYPNPYIGLEKAILTDVSPTAPILNFPLLLAQINSSDPSAVYLQQPHWPTSFGMIYPEEREFIPQVSTIAQFRTIDFAMERCVVTLAIPSPADLRNIPSKRVLSSNEPCPLEIWSLDAPDDIRPRILSWTTRPRRINLLTTMIVRPGRNLLDSPPFPCPSRTLLAFELNYSTAACHLHFRQDKKSPRLGELTPLFGLSATELLDSVLHHTISECSLNVCWIVQLWVVQRLRRQRLLLYSIIYFTELPTYVSVPESLFGDDDLNLDQQRFIPLDFIFASSTYPHPDSFFEWL
ncbi:hypothetical protein DFH09DRAFT_1045381 [Mycena vulgaris]|nr:hypothetical protein DFH09DRAFT_1045381 [Mycena vulgaris]